MSVMFDPGQVSVDYGGEREYLILTVQNQGVFIKSIHEMSILHSFWMLLQNFLHGHRYIEIQGNETKVRVCRHVSERGFYLADIMDTDRYFFAVPPQAPVQVFLQSHQALNTIIIELQPTYYGTAQIRPDTFNLIIQCNRDVGLFHFIFRQSGFNTQKTSHTPGHTFRTVQVRSIREELDINMVFFNAFDIGPHHGYPFNKCIPVCSC